MLKLNDKQKLSNQPLVSICIPTYNAEKTVVQTVQSILNQTYHNMEIIIVDNASTDDTLALLRKFNDPRMKIHKNTKNIGAEKNFSRCVELAKGKYIAIFHADDLYMPDMVQKQVRAFQDNPTVGAVFTTVNIINSRGEIIGEGKLPVELRSKEIYFFPEIFLSLLENGNFFVSPSAMVKSKLYKKLMPFNVERFGTSADLDMWLRILEEHPVAILDEKLMSYRISYTHGTYQFGYVRTEQADFFKVVDYYLSVESGALSIPRSVLNKYGFIKSIDKIRCAVSCLAKGKSGDAKKLLRESFSPNIFGFVIGSIGKPKFLAYGIAYWIFGVILLVFVHLGLGRYLGKRLHYLRYKWKMRFV